MSERGYSCNRAVVAVYLCAAVYYIHVICVWHNARSDVARNTIGTHDSVLQSRSNAKVEDVPMNCFCYWHSYHASLCRPWIFDHDLHIQYTIIYIGNSVTRVIGDYSAFEEICVFSPFELAVMNAIANRQNNICRINYSIFCDWSIWTINC